MVAAVTVTDPENRDWMLEEPTDADCVSILGILYEDGEARLYVTGGEKPGECELVMRSESEAVELRLSCTLTSEGLLLVEKHHASYGDKPAPTEATEPPLHHAESTGEAVETQEAPETQETPESQETGETREP